MNKPHHRYWQKKISILCILLAVVFVSSCRTVPVKTPEQQAREKEVREMLLRQREVASKESTTTKVTTPQWKRESEEFKKELTADTDAFPDLQVDIVVAVNALAQEGVSCKNTNWSKGAELTSQVEGLADKRWEVSQRDTPYYHRMTHKEPDDLDRIDGDVLSIHGVARLLFVSVDTVRRIPFSDLAYTTGPGRRNLYLRKDVERYIRTKINEQYDGDKVLSDRKHQIDSLADSVRECSS